MRVIRREAKKSVLALKAASVLVGLAAASPLFLVYGLNPLEVYSFVVSSSLFTPVGLSESLVRAIPLLLVSTGLAASFKTGFWNIGAEGQLLAGAMAAFVLIRALSLPAPLMIPLLFLTGFAAGAVWAGIPALLKVKLEVNEVISTLMLYYVIYWAFQHLIHGPWKAVEKVGSLTYGGFAHTEVIPESAQLPTAFGRVHWPTLLLALVLAFLTYFLLEKTPWGFEMRAVGSNPDAAKASGMAYLRAIMLAVAISGGYAGLAGVGELCGVQKRFTPEFLSGYGFMGIITAWLAGTNPLSLVLTNFLYGALLVGGEGLMIEYQLPLGVVNMFNGVILLSVLAADFFVRYEVRFE